MSNQQQQNKVIQTNSVNVNNSNDTSNYCNSQIMKSMEEWLNNGNNNNNNGIANIDNDSTNPNANYQQKHFDDWLNATMKDSPKTFSVSSTDILDGTTRMPDFHVS